MLLSFLSLLEALVDGQSDCPMLTGGDLGSTNAASDRGLLAGTLAAVSANASIQLQILEYNIVCLSQGTMRSKFQYVSVVVRFFRLSDGMDATVQVEYECYNGVWRSRGLTLNPLATLSTSVTTTCTLCLGPEAPRAVIFSPVEHCVGKFFSIVMLLILLYAILGAHGGVQTDTFMHWKCIGNIEHWPFCGSVANTLGFKH